MPTVLSLNSDYIKCCALNKKLSHYYFALESVYIFNDSKRWRKIYTEEFRFSTHEIHFFQEMSIISGKFFFVAYGRMFGSYAQAMVVMTVMRLMKFMKVMGAMGAIQAMKLIYKSYKMPWIPWNLLALWTSSGRLLSSYIAAHNNPNWIFVKKKLNF